MLLLHTICQNQYVYKIEIWLLIFVDKYNCANAETIASLLPWHDDCMMDKYNG